MKRALGLAGLVALVVGIRVQTGPGVPRAVRALAPPIRSADPAQRGLEVYVRYGCVLCHGSDGKGGVANPNAQTDAKIPSVVYVKEGYTARELRLKILDGAPSIGQADSKGPTPPYRMPGWRGQMTDEEVADLVQFLVSLYPKTAEEKWR